MKTISGGIIFCIVVLYAIISFRSNNVADGKTNVITWDVYGYNVLLQGAVIYKDIEYFNFADKQLDKYKFSESIYQLKTLSDGRSIPIYTIGLALAQFPFFILADVFTVVSGSYPRDGMSFPYQLAVLIGSLTYCCVGFIFLTKVISKYYDDYVSSLVLLIISLGTNYFCYVAFEPGMPHAILFSLYCMLLYVIDKWYDKSSLILSILIGLLYAEICLIRAAECVSILIFIFYDWRKFTSGKEFLLFWNSVKKYLVVIFLSSILLLLPQVLYWRWITGNWIYNAYKADNHFFEWLHPHIINGLFSYQKGWLIYTPVMIFSIVGLILMLLKKQKSAPAIALYLILNIYIVFSWHLWSYTSSFGMRALVQSYAFLSIPMAFFIQNVINWNRIVRVVAFFLILFLIALNLFQI